MKKLLALAAIVLTPLMLVGSSGFNYTCVDGNLGENHCLPGHVRFVGYGTPNTIHITVTRTSDGTVYDDFDYDATGGVEFTETLYPAGNYVVTLTDYPFATSQVVTTGGGHDN